jgi:pyridoxal 5'-phosphate synthase glutaminase subunit Pdx2
MAAGALAPAIEAFHQAGRPIFGTCAGLIVLAREVVSPRQVSLGLIDASVERNAYGRQRESFEAHGVAALDGQVAEIEMVFIRAPRIRQLGPGVEVLARLDDEPVLARQDTVLVATFHPELTDDSTVHQYFVSHGCGLGARGRGEFWPDRAKGSRRHRSPRVTPVRTLLTTPRRGSGLRLRLPRDSATRRPPDC